MLELILEKRPQTLFLFKICLSLKEEKEDYVDGGRKPAGKREA